MEETGSLTPRLTLYLSIQYVRSTDIQMLFPSLMENGLNISLAVGLLAPVNSLG